MLMTIEEVVATLPRIMEFVLLFFVEVCALLGFILIFVRFVVYMLSLIKEDIEKVIEKVYK